MASAALCCALQKVGVCHLCRVRVEEVEGTSTMQTTTTARLRALEGYRWVVQARLLSMNVVTVVVKALAYLQGVGPPFPCRSCS